MTDCERCGQPARVRTTQTIGSRTLKVCGPCVVARNNNAGVIASRIARKLKGT